jgi:hypothetical protein
MGGGEGTTSHPELKTPLLKIVVFDMDMSYEWGLF